MQCGAVQLILFLAVLCCLTGCSNDTAPHAEKTKPTATADDAVQESALPEAAAEEKDELYELISGKLESHRPYRHPSAAEIEQATLLFTQTLSPEADREHIRSAWESAGFELHSVDRDGEEFWILSESPRKQFGRGIVAIRCSRFVPVMIQAPHSFFDLGTGEISLALFSQTQARACFWNSAHRRAADLTKEEQSFLNAATAAFARTNPHGRIVQIHGFAQRENDHRFSRHLDLILSQGTNSPTESFLITAHGIRRQCKPYVTAIYPLDVNELGGTLNQQRQVLLNEGFSDFMHCELSPLFRKGLQEDANLLDRFGQAITHLERNP